MRTELNNENFVKVNHHPIIDEMQKAQGQEVITIDTRLPLQEMEAESDHWKPSTTMTCVIISSRRRSGSTTFLRKQNVYIRIPSPSLLTVFPQKEV